MPACQIRAPDQGGIAERVRRRQRLGVCSRTTGRFPRLILASTGSQGRPAPVGLGVNPQTSSAERNFKVPFYSSLRQTGTKWNLDGCRAGRAPICVHLRHLRFIPCWARGRRPGRVQSSTVQGSTVQRFKVQGSGVQRPPVFPSSLFKGCDRVQLCCLCCLLLEWCRADDVQMQTEADACHPLQRAR